MKPSEGELRELYEKHDGVFASIARELGVSESTIKSRYYRKGITAKKKLKLPSDKKMAELYEKFDGNASEIARHLDVTRAPVSARLTRLGLAPKGVGGKEPTTKYRTKYPLQIDLSIRNGRMAVFGDAHWWPEERTAANEALLRYLRKQKVDIVVANGDVPDGARINRFDQVSWDDLPMLADELHIARQRMAEIAKEASGAEKIYTVGNHCARFEKYIIKHAKELGGLPGTSLQDYFIGWTLCWSLKINADTHHPVMVKHRYRGGVHAAFNNVREAGITIVTNHVHRQVVIPFTDYRGTRYGVDTGFLADIDGNQFAYCENDPKNWRSGFAVLHFKDGKLLPPSLATVTDWGEVYMMQPVKI